MPKQRKIKHYRYGYSSRRQRRIRIWKGLLFILLLAVLVFIGYCVTKAVRNLVNRPEESSIPSSQTESLPPESSETSEPESSSEPYEPVRVSIRAVVLPKESMGSLEAAAAFLDTVDSSRYNSVAVELKDSAGTLYYTSGVELAKTCQAISPNALDASALAQLIRDKGFIPAARIYALQDDIASHTAYSTSYMYLDQASVTWLDRAADKGGKSWLNPYMANAVDYLASLSGEIAEAGFETIFACGIQYPNSKYPAEMGFGPEKSSMTTVEALQNVLDQMETQAARYGGSVIPVFLGDGYLEQTNGLYSDSANIFQADVTSPLLDEGRESEILAAVTAPVHSLVPSLQSESQIPLLKAAGIEQYLVN